MDILIKAVQLFLSLSILIVIHELGHFTFARIFKTRVEKFYLFFNPWFSIFKFKKGETEFGLGWLPIGGYVKIAGMIDESMDTEQMKQPVQDWEFRAKPAWQRLLIMLGGVVANLLLAFAIYSMILFTWGKEYLPVANLPEGVVWDSLAINSGLRNGDKVLKVDNHEIGDFDEITKHIVNESAKTITVERGGRKVVVTLPDDFVLQMIEKKVRPLVSPIFPFIIDSVMPNRPAQQAGFIKGDKIIAINGIPTLNTQKAVELISSNKDKEINVTVNRRGTENVLKVKVDEEGRIGIGALAPQNYFKFEKEEYGFFRSLPAGVSFGSNVLVNYIKQLKYIFTKEGAESLGGFIAIGNLFEPTWNWESFWMMTAFLSIMLSFLNVLPIPALDGGHVMFLFYEMVTRKKPSDKFMEYSQLVGLFILLALVLFANANDIVRLFE